MDARTLRLLEYDKIRDLLRAHAASALGKELIGRMKPVRDPALVRTRLAETSEARRVLLEGDAPFGGLHDVREPLHRAEKRAVLTAAELQDIAETAACCRRLRRYLGTAEAMPLLRHQAHLMGDFRALEAAIDRAIAPNGDVVDDASAELAATRRRVRALHEELQRELQRLVSSPSMQDVLQEPLVTQRNGRFCVPVRAEARNSVKGIVHDLSASGQTVFMEPLSVVELGNDLREAERREEEEVQRVLASLSTLAGSAAPTLLESMDAAARLDAIFARAHYARALDAVEPTLHDDGVIDLIEARHPLLGAVAVPIDIALGQDSAGTLLITGPNTGGKTVTLKTVGLLTLMAQSGLHLPVKHGSRIALFDQVFADIGDEQSIEQSLSTFSGHMTNIVRIVTEAKGKALILLDEIGAGTDPAEGAALAKAILLELHARGCRTIATTHYGELKVFAQSTAGFLNASVEFDPETLRPTYRVISGLPGSSNAFYISQRLGLPKPIVAAAKELMGEAPQALEQVLKQAEGVRRALDRERTAATRARQEAEADAAQLHSAREAFDAQREGQLAQAREKARAIVQKAREESNALLDELKTALREARDRRAPATDTAGLKTRRQQVLRDLTAEVEETVPAAELPPTLQSVRAGQSVFVRSVGHRGLVLEDGDGAADVEVQVGIMRIRVPVQELEAAQGEAAAPAKPSIVTSGHVPNPEIQLIGLRAEEAMAKLENYLYDALSAGLTSVRIVHGFGTGALRTAVTDLLRSHPGVASYRPGDRSEGGGGVTIATLGTP
jgi:DNA mismatch repair protein MutS2